MSPFVNSLSCFPWLAGLLGLLAAACAAEVAPQASRTTAPLDTARGAVEPCQSRTSARWGLCRADGSQAPPVVAPRFDFIGPGTTLFPARLEPGQRLGYIDRRGEWRIAPGFDTAYPVSEGIAVVSRGAQSAGLDADGQPVIAWFDGLLYPPSQGLACFVPAGRIALNPAGRLRQRLWGEPGDPPYPAPWWHLQGRAGFLDTRGRVAIAPRFEPRASFVAGGCGFSSTGFAAMRQDGRDGLIDRTGRWVVPPQYTWLGLVFSGNRQVTAMVADRLVEPGWFLDTVERRDGFLGPDGALRWRETGPPRPSPVAGGLGRTLLNQVLFPRWQQDLTREDVSSRMLLAWVASLLLGLAAALLLLQAARPAWWRWPAAAAAAAATAVVVFLAGLLSMVVSGVLLAAGLAVCARRFSRRGRRAVAP